MLMSVQEFLLRPGIMLLPKDSKSRLGNFGVHVFGIYPNNLSSHELKSYAMLSESEIQFLYGIFGYPIYIFITRILL